MLIRTAVLVLGAAFVSAPASAGLPDIRQPTDKWTVNFDDAQCVALRNYGSDKEPLYLTIKAPPVGDVLQLGVLRNGPGSEPVLSEGEVEFDAGPALETTLLDYGSNNKRRTLVTLPASTASSVEKAKIVYIHARASKPVPGTRMVAFGRSTNERFALTQMPELMGLMRNCVKDLRRVWNVYDDGQPSPFKSGPKGNFQGIFNPEDYPDVALDRELSGRVRIAMLIDEKGAVADCTVIQSSGVAVLDSQSCAIVRTRAKLRPAIGQDGKPAKSSYVQGIGWIVE